MIQGWNSDAVLGDKGFVVLYPVNLNRTAAVAFFDKQVERKAKGVIRRPLPQKTTGDGVAEALLRDIDPESPEQSRDCVPKVKTSERLTERKQLKAKPQERSKPRQKERAKEID